MHLKNDIAAADELAHDIELRDRRPVREDLDALTDFGVLEDINVGVLQAGRCRRT